MTDAFCTSNGAMMNEKVFEQWLAVDRRRASQSHGPADVDWLRLAFRDGYNAALEEAARVAEQTFEGSCYSPDGDSGMDFMGENSAAAIRALKDAAPREKR